MGRKRTTCKLQIAQFTSDTYLLLACLRHTDEGLCSGNRMPCMQRLDLMVAPQDIYDINHSIEDLY